MCLLLAVPMFHANGWGLPFAAPAAGTKLVLPGRNLDGASLARLMREEGVTVAVGVQTVWLGLADHLDKAGGDLPALKRILIGGSSCPEALIRRMETAARRPGPDQLGNDRIVANRDDHAALGASCDSQASGRPPMGLDLKLTDADGSTLPSQRGVVGHLKARGHSVVERYFKAETDALDDEGWFDTGDLAIIDEDGNLTIAGRSKDLIKSGGEWINPTEIEAIVGRDPSVRNVAVIGRSDSKWGERPVLIVEPLPEGQGDPARLARSAARQGRRLVDPATRWSRWQRCRSPPPARSTRTACARTMRKAGSGLPRRRFRASHIGNETPFALSLSKGFPSLFVTK